MPTIIYLLAIAFALIFLFVIFAAVSYKPIEHNPIIDEPKDVEHWDNIKMVPTSKAREPRIRETINV